MIARLPHPRSIAIVAAVVIVAFAIAGTIVGTYTSGSPFNLVNEKTIPAFFSGAVLGCVGLCALLAAHCRIAAKPIYWVAFALLMLVMSFDEVAGLHEKIEHWSGIDWQTVYAPVFVVAAVVWWMLLSRLERLPRAMLLAGAAAWAVAQVLEYFEYDSADQPVRGFSAMVIVEETLETTGSVLFLLAVVITLRATLPSESRRP